MIAMEYAFAFPDDFDMAVIRRRVADKGRHFDRYPGLHRKAFLARDHRPAGQAGPAGDGKSYATFYLWSSAEAAASFLGGPDFAAVCAAFGRPTVRLLAPIAIVAGREMAVPTVALRSVAKVSPEADLGAEIASQRANLAALGGQPGFQSGILSLDSTNWSIHCFTLWTAAANARVIAQDGQTQYEVLHLSTGAQDIPCLEAPYRTTG